MLYNFTTGHDLYYIILYKIWNQNYAKMGKFEMLLTRSKKLSTVKPLKTVLAGVTENFTVSWVAQYSGGLTIYNQKTIKMYAYRNFS